MYICIMEIYKDIEGWEGKYQISNLGNTKSLHSYAKNKERIMRPATTKKGYLNVCLSRDSCTKMYQVHRLVAQAFIPNPDNKPTVNHKNGVKDDNHESNLEWMTYKENSKHAFDTGLTVAKSGSNHHRSRKTLQYSLDGVFLMEYHSTTEAGLKSGIGRGGIKNCLRGMNKTAGGYVWKYKQNE